jgi:hypothetical protein
MKSFVRTGREAIKHDYSSLWSFLDRIGYSLKNLDAGNPNLEELFTVLQTISTAIWYTSRKEYIESVGDDFAKMRPIDLLLSFIIEVLDAPSLSARSRPCKYHRRLFSSLRPGDTIITFNYDLIADFSLRAEHNWNEAGGYGFACHSRMVDLNSKGLFDINMPCDVALLKPHGSLNWQLEKYSLPSPLAGEPSVLQYRRKPIREELLGRQLTGEGLGVRVEVTALDDIEDHCYNYLPIDAFHLNRKLLGGMNADERHLFFSDGVTIYNSAFIVPPSAYKFGSNDIPADLIEIWAHMNTALSTAGEILCIGYSFPLTDVEFSSLFRLALLQNSRSGLEVKIVNPDPSVAEKIVSMIPGTRVKHVATSFSEYEVH